MSRWCPLSGGRVLGGVPGCHRERRQAQDVHQGCHRTGRRCGCGDGGRHGPDGGAPAGCQGEWALWRCRRCCAGSRPAECAVRPSASAQNGASEHAFAASLLDIAIPESHRKLIVEVRLAVLAAAALRRPPPREPRVRPRRGRVCAGGRAAPTSPPGPASPACVPPPARPPALTAAHASST